VNKTAQEAQRNATELATIAQNLQGEIQVQQKQLAQEKALVLVLTANTSRATKLVAESGGKFSRAKSWFQSVNSMLQLTLAGVRNKKAKLEEAEAHMKSQVEVFNAKQAAEIKAAEQENADIKDRIEGLSKHLTELLDQSAGHAAWRFRKLEGMNLLGPTGGRSLEFLTTRHTQLGANSKATLVSCSGKVLLIANGRIGQCMITKELFCEGQPTDLPQKGRLCHEKRYCKKLTQAPQLSHLEKRMLISQYNATDVNGACATLCATMSTV